MLLVYTMGTAERVARMGGQQEKAYFRLAPSLCIFDSSKSDIHEIIMNPLDWEKKLLSREIQDQPHILVKKSFSPHIIP